MNNDFVTAMRQAAAFLRAQNVVQATRLIQSALARKLAGDPGQTAVGAVLPKPEFRLIARDAETDSAAKPSATRMEGGGMGAGAAADLEPGVAQRARRPLGDVLRALRNGRPILEPFGPSSGARLPGMRRPSPPPIPDGAEFVRRSYSCAAGTRDYKLYVPASAKERPSGLIVMLHGCKQDPDDFALGTNMNAVAEAHGLLIAYPAQTSSANPSSCWNWFSPVHQTRDIGEPSIVAGMTQALVVEFGVDRRRVFIAGLSAGGAAAAVMAETYPDLYAAVGIHSGLAYRSANDVISAFAAMRGDFNPSPPAKPASACAGFGVRTIVFHGSADRAVVPSNAARIVADARRHFSGRPARDIGRAVNGRNFTRTTVLSGDGIPAVEFWLIEGAGHAWSGGRLEGSFTDPQGPDASAEMARFFLADPNSIDKRTPTRTVEYELIGR
jgi:poly(hydroxyalkanoate) depolymerase family esterase